MTHRCWTLGVLILGSLLSAQASSQGIEELMDLLVGDFDNQRQYASQFDDSALSSTPAGENGGGDPNAADDPLFSHLGLQRRRVSAPGLGEYVIYAQINRRADPTDIYRQTLQVLTPLADGGIRAHNVRFAQPERFPNIIEQPQQLKTLGAAEVVAALPDSCDPIWRYEQGLWVSRILPGQCQITSRRDGRPRFIQATEIVERDLIRNEESGYTEQGEMIFGLPPDTFYRYDRVQH